MTDKKYIVLPGYVISKNDLDKHFITAQQLINLYNVDINDCIIIPYGSEHRPKGYSEEDFNKMIKLYPKYNGDYKP